MKLLHAPGSFKILTPPEFMTLQLLIVEEAGRTCYQSETEPITVESARRFVKGLIRSGHTSVLEHTLIVVKFFGCSRGFTHEAVRHRHTGFSQESTRYVDYAKGEDRPDLERFNMSFVAPPHRKVDEPIRVGPDAEMTPEEMVSQIETFYRALRKAGWPPEDARQFLPIGVESELVMSASFRQWRAIFGLRTNKAAHWEIRSVMCAVLVELQNLVPVIFDDFELAGEDTNGVPYYIQTQI